MHIPVLKNEVIEYLDPESNENFIDCTMGFGGHTMAIADKIGPNGKILGIELDPSNYQRLKNLFKDKDLTVINNSFANLKNIVKNNNFYPINGILLDIGMSSWHIDKSGRGFSFAKNEPLDMRYNPETNITASKIINEYNELEIEDILKKYGEEKFARQIAKKIVENRKIKKIETTDDLIEIIKKAISKNYLREKKHFATRTFQALRIAVNKELDNLESVIPQALELLEKDGRLVIISFHSLEDRIVKNFFKNQDKNKFEILTKKPITPSREEIQKNQRARSAKLRAIKKI